MTTARRPADDSRLPLSVLQRVDEAGDRFEDALAAGEPPALEDYLTDTPEPERSLLLHELLALELGYRRGSGETPTPAEYLARFPDHAAVIHDAFGAQGSVACKADASVPDSRLRPGEGRPTERGGTAPLPVVPGYEVLGELGHGGMGVVYRARDTRLDRVVALKMIRAGIQASAEELARFRREAALQAHVQHPHIVQIFEIGETAGGPYFVQEFVDGSSLEKQLAGTPQPAATAAPLVETLARAMHHAHKKGLVHRDLKPANILLTADGTPKVGDFGLAKRLEGAAGQTQSGAVLGTPSYMAPEQAWGRLEAIGPATDVYALGAILYETLTGRPPFLGATGLDTVLQVREREPVPPRRLLPTVPRDLETICLKCLRKEPAQRYASALALADDLKRFLGGEPIRARPSSMGEKAVKWIKRRPAAAGLIAVSGAALKETQDQRDRAERERAVAEAVGAFLQRDLLGQADVGNQPSLADSAQRNPNITVREVLDRAAASIAGKFPDQPEVEAALRSTIGSAYWALGKFDQAQEQLVWVRAWNQEHRGPDDVHTLDGLARLAGVYVGKFQFSQAESLFQEVLAGHTRQRGPDDPCTLSARSNLGWLYYLQGRYAEAEPLLREVLDAKRRVLGPDHPYTLHSLSNLAMLCQKNGRNAEAERLLKECLVRCPKVQGADHPHTLEVLDELATLYRCSGRYAEAEPPCRAALDGRRRVLGTDHPDTLRSLYNLAVLSTNRGQAAEAESSYRELLTAARRGWDDDHPLLLMGLDGLAHLYNSLQRYAEAEPLFREAWKRGRRRLGPRHPDTLRYQNNLGEFYWSQGRSAEAEPLLREALEGQRQVNEADHPHVLGSLNNLALVYRSLGRYAEAEPLFLQALAGAKRRLGPTDSTTQTYMRNTAGMYEEGGQPEKAEPLWRELVEISRPPAGAASSAHATCLAELGFNLLRQRRPADAEPLLRTALAVRQQKEPDAWRTFNTQSLLGGALAAQQQYAQAEPLLVAGYKGMKARENTMPPLAQVRLTEALERLVQLYEAWNKPDQAKVWRQQLERAKRPKKEPPK